MNNKKLPIRRKQPEPTRNEVLKLLIDEMFMSVHPDIVDTKAPCYDETLTEMFEVVQTKKKSMILMHLYDDIEFKPVFFPPEVHALVKRRDVFLMTLGRTEDAWHVIWMSPPYDQLNGCLFNR